MNHMALGRILSQSLSRNEHFAAPAMRPTAPRPAANHAPSSLSKNLNRLLSAAVVSPRFQRLLLTDPVAALAAGYNGENFHLTPVEYSAVTSLRVNSVRDFAAQLLRMLSYSPSTGDSARYSSEVQADFHFAEVAAQ